MALRSVALLAIAVACAADTWAFGSPGHMAVGNLADQLIQGSAAEREIRKFLPVGETPKEAAIWPDCARGVVQAGAGFDYRPDPKYHDKHCAAFETSSGEEEMKAYVARNWDNCEYEHTPKQCH